MKIANRKFSRLLACALVFLLALTAVVPVFAEPAEKNNLKITIHNNTGLPEMKANQFKVYQLFSGTPHRESDPDTTNPEKTEWNASEWNNWTLANIEWGASVPEAKQGDLLKALRELQLSEAKWLGEVKENPFKAVNSAAAVAAVLADHTENKFMQGFADFLLDGGYLTPLSDDDVHGTVDLRETPTDYSDDTLTYTVPSTGYYLFAETADDHSGSSGHKDDAVSEYIIAVMGDQEINLKASVPTVDKNIVSGKGRLKGDAVGISDTVVYELTGKLPKNFDDFDSYEYTFHDTLSKGLTFLEDDANVTVTVTITSGEKAGTYTIAKNSETGYQLETDSTSGDGTKITISFKDLKKLMGKKDGEGSDELIPYAAPYDTTVTFTVQYSVTVNKDAVIGAEGNPNEVYLEYSNDPNSDSKGETKEKKVIVYSFALDLTKVGSDKPEAKLPGAGFVLSKTEGEDTYYAQFETAEDGGRRLKGWVKQGKNTEAGEVDVKGLIDAYKDAKKAYDSASDGSKEGLETKLQSAKNALNDYLLESKGDSATAASGIDAGTYTLTEAVTPDGYNKMDDIEFTITATTQTPPEDGAEAMPGLTELSAKVTKGSNAEFKDGVKEKGSLPVTLTNQKAPFLPFTGGIGTLIFYVLGVTLIAGAVSYLVLTSKKRKKAEGTA